MTHKGCGSEIKFSATKFYDYESDDIEGYEEAVK